MKSINFKTFTIVLTACFSIGVAIDYFTLLHWLPTGFMVLSAILFNGVAISIEDHQPDGWDHVENDNPINQIEYKKMIRLQIFLTITAFVCGLVSYAYTSN